MMNLSATAYEQLLNPSPTIRYYFLTCHSTQKSATGQATNASAASSASAPTSKRLTM